MLFCSSSVLINAMKNTFPDYYKDFRCIADKCPDTCCAGWEVVVDDDSLEKYSSLKGDYADILRSRITVDSDGDSIFAPVRGNCPFLLDNGLCEMYIEIGEDSLCRTCRQFPRHITYFGARIETGISLSCPEAARLILQDKKIGFETEEYDGFPEPTSIDPNLYFTLLEARKTSIDILQNRKFSVRERICAFLELCNEISPCIRRNSCGEVREIIKKDFLKKKDYQFNPSRAKRLNAKLLKDFSELEMLDTQWKSALEAAFSSAEIRGCENEFENLAVYFVFRYFMLAVFDRNLLAKAKFTVASFLVIRRLVSCTENKSERIRAMQKFSKEVEHSALNMEFLENQIRKSRCYSVENLINNIWEK